MIVTTETLMLDMLKNGQQSIDEPVAQSKKPLVRTAA